MDRIAVCGSAEKMMDIFQEIESLFYQDITLRLKKEVPKQDEPFNFNKLSKTTQQLITLAEIYSGIHSALSNDDISHIDLKEDLANYIQSRKNENLCIAAICLEEYLPSLLVNQANENTRNLLKIINENSASKAIAHLFGKNKYKMIASTANLYGKLWEFCDTGFSKILEILKNLNIEYDLKSSTQLFNSIIKAEEINGLDNRLQPKAFILRKHHLLNEAKTRKEVRLEKDSQKIEKPPLTQYIRENMFIPEKWRRLLDYTDRLASSLLTKEQIEKIKVSEQKASKGAIKRTRFDPKQYPEQWLDVLLWISKIDSMKNKSSELADKHESYKSAWEAYCDQREKYIKSRSNKGRTVTSGFWIEGKWTPE